MMDCNSSSVFIVQCDQLTELIRDVTIISSGNVYNLEFINDIENY